MIVKNKIRSYKVQQKFIKFINFKINLDEFIFNFAKTNIPIDNFHLKNILILS